MNTPNLETLRSLLEEVPYEALHSYFKTNDIPLPKDGSREKLVDLLLTPEYKKDVRAAVLVELKAASRSFAGDLKESSDKLQALTSEMNAKLAAIDGWKQLFQVSGLIFGMVAFVGGAFGSFKLWDLQRDAAAAREQLTAGTKIVGGYRQFMLSTTSRSVSSTMNSASTRWFRDADTSVPDDLAIYRANLERLQDVPSASAEEASSLETQLILKFIVQLESIANSPPEDPSQREYAEAELRWQNLGAEWDAALAAKKVSKVQAETYLSYVSNVRGIFSHSRYRALDRKKNPAEARRYLEQAQKHFESSINLRGAYSPAVSNLGVVLLDILEMRIKFPRPGEQRANDKDFERADELLVRARDMRQQPSRTQSRVHNNLAMSSLLKAVLLATNGNQRAALDQLSVADRHLDHASVIPSAPAVVWASKAEIAAFRAVLRDRIGQSAEFDIQKVKEGIDRAISAKYPFESSLDKALEESPAFSEFHVRFRGRSDEIWGRVFSKS